MNQESLAEGATAILTEGVADQGLFLKEGTVVDATIISAPSSTKNKAKARDPEMHSTRKGNQYYFGMKAHIGTDAEIGRASCRERV